jgi:hypothetical protein
MEDDPMNVAKAALLLSFLAAPAFAGSVGFELPNLTWPDVSTVASTAGAPAPVQTPAPGK